MDLQDLVSLAKRRGIIIQSSEIYGGLNGCWDYGPVGVELKRNVKQAWWNAMIQSRTDVVGIDSTILMNSRVWEASGHVSGFSDPLVDCKTCKGRFRADQLADTPCPQKPSKMAGQADSCQLTQPRSFNLMFQTHVGAMADASSVAYLRPETAQGMFVNFRYVAEAARMKIPFGIGQIGKSFRNEINPRNFTFRTREFEQMEMEFFTHPTEADEWYSYWRKTRYQWYIDLGMKTEKLHLRDHEQSELAHYARACSDVEYDFPFGRGELEGIANRTDYDLKKHSEFSGKDLSIFDPDRKEKFVPFVIEPAAGADRATLAFLCDAYAEDEVENEKRLVLRLHPKLAPVKAALFPLIKSDDQMSVTTKLMQEIQRHYVCQMDHAGSIGKRYRRQDEIGTPFCFTIDHQTMSDQTVTVRWRDTTKQDRIPISSCLNFLRDQL